MATSKVAKKRLVTSFQNLTPELQEQVKAQYPLGFTDAMMRIDKPNGDFFYAVPFEADEVIFLVKIAVTIDDSEKMEKDLFSDDIVEAEMAKGEDGGVDLEGDDEI
ncbi:MAG: hypothetical protein SNI45_06060 [Rikenellaceae bacterium]